MPERDANQLAADVRAFLTEHHATDGACRMPHPCSCSALPKFDALVALVGALQQERDYLRDRGDKNARRAEAAEAALAEERDGFHRQLQRADALDSALATARQALTDFAEHGTRYDCNPTVMIVNDEKWLAHHQWWVNRATNMDNAVRERARRALAATRGATAREVKADPALFGESNRLLGDVT